MGCCQRCTTFRITNHENDQTSQFYTYITLALHHRVSSFFLARLDNNVGFILSWNDTGRRNEFKKQSMWLKKRYECIQGIDPCKYVIGGWLWKCAQHDDIMILLALCEGNPPMDSPHRGQWWGTLVFSLLLAWANCWVNSRSASDLKRHDPHRTSL